jgi:hypothetical protein
LIVSKFNDYFRKNGGQRIPSDISAPFSATCFPAQNSIFQAANRLPLPSR